MNRQEKEQAVARQIAELPLLSSSATQLLALGGTADHGLAEIVRIVKHDAILTSRVLKVVNSAAYARAVEIHAIDHAVSLLGEDMVVATALHEAAGLLLAKRLTGYAAEAGELWRHNLKTALAAKLLAPRARSPVNGELAFTCGLLHDLGKVVISDYLEQTAGKIRQAIEQGRFPDYLAAERAILGIDHAEAGYKICRRWQLPTPLAESCRHHHQPAAAAENWQGLLYVVHLADIVAMLSGVGTGADTLQYRLDGDYERHLELDEAGLNGIMLAVEREFAQVWEIFC
ncbi:HDOD domain-containing protein [Desulfurivibrio sp. D14AmB]|uniref:HDOD domain-containing protein n=1 Tax=Desulfurivibrio sp. D14AmB TaxID=3374370 RepID=UPI00376EE70D